MFICEHCRKALDIDRTASSAEILLALTKHQLEDCIVTPKWALSMPAELKNRPPLGSRL